MQILYLPAARDDLLWLRHYYTTVFPDGAARALRHILAVEEALRANPFIGKRAGFADARELVIPRTPFSFIYRVRNQRIEILRVWDNRADRTELGPEEEMP